ncbi:EAL domain-containing protein [Anaerocolumna sedimenticola]|uniref:EAL domain-containing protein n=1 Tax=Anaerocolumna sedimenticola TaxID=2696063 RepID=A0A6P1TP61_9FIRM|nr:EAL domain-containing protein [Anaerocolumna sedimenticola]QHQ61972.1 EAL domain-containing protein [Anaerocolumna sedimenticola]
MQYNKIELQTLTDGGKAYIVDWGIGNIIILAALVLIILLIILLVICYGKTKSEKAALLEKQNLSNNYTELETAYEEISTAKNELSIKYDELKRSKDKMQKLAYSDYLTELPNRLAFTEVLDGVMLTLRNEEVIAIMNVDIDNFKAINDTLGHSYGDELLIDVTHRLKQAMDDNDYLARSGGDEFVVLTQNLTDIGEYEAKIKKIRKIFDYPFVLSMKEYFITVSIGIALAPKDGKTTQVLIKNADSAMYAAKANGKNTFVYFNDAINEKLMDKIQIQSELRKAIENNEFIVYYQPQIDLSTEKIVGFEALIRWNHPEKGILSPGEFIAFTEETGLIVPIGYWVLKSACCQLKKWEEEGFHNLTIAVNISARQFKDQDFANMVRETINETGINPGNLELEITESIALLDLEYSVAMIQKLKDLGVKFSLDNFGTDYSSMNYLKRLPVNNLKIDKSFLDSVTDNRSEQNIVQTIISLAQNLDIAVIAEGVEKNEQAQFLKSVKCNKAQGFLFSEPVSGDMADQVLKKIGTL